MPEHTIPQSLIENIRRGRAALVVGAGIGVPSWKSILERMNEEVARRGHPGDEAAHKDVAKLLHKGSLVPAAGFLARTLGEGTCDRIVSEEWRTPEELPAVARALARLPFKQVWSTFPGDLLEHAFEEVRPADWPAPRVVTYAEVDAIDPRRSYLLKVLGDFQTYVVTPKSVRAALAKAASLREFVRDLYGQGSLVFVGFRFGDPDLSALLDRVFGTLEPPKSEHYLVASGVGPVTVDELRAEHDIQVVNLAGKGVDETALAALIEYLEALAAACESAGITLAQAQPEADDLEGWMTVLEQDSGSQEARNALAAMTQQARDIGNAERLVEILMSRLELEAAPAARAALLREVAAVFENLVGDLPKAFTALTAALREVPADTTAVDEAERLAAETDGWAELVADVSVVAREIEDRAIAATYWVRLGRWYLEKLHHFDYALASYREALKREPAMLAAHTGVAEVLRKQQRWAELADQLATHLAHETDSSALVDLYLSLGDLQETQLASTSRAVEAYQKAVDLDDRNQDALAAVERLYRRDERWGKLALVLERRAELFEEAGAGSRASALRHELATLRAEELGDLEGAIAKYETVLASDAGDVEALRALEDLYERSGRTDDTLHTLERLVDVAPDSDRVTMLRRLAAELEERTDRRAQVIACHERILEIDGNAEDAYRALERHFKSDGKWYELCAILERHIGAVKAPAPRVALFSEMAQICETELADPHKAIEAHLNAIAIASESRDHLQALAALVRLYQRIEAWDRAADCLVKRAELEGASGAESWCEAGVIAAERMEDLDVAERWLEKALALRPGLLPAMLALARLHKKRSSWANAVARLKAAEAASQNRLERISLLAEAADIAAENLDDAELALALQRKILELDPEHLEAGVRTADRLVAENRWAEAEPVLEMLARRADPGDRAEKARREALLGKACEQLGKCEKAQKHYGLAVEADPESLEASLGLASMQFELARTAGADGNWAEVDKRYREILARHRQSLADGDVVEAWFRVGVAARRLGDERKADNAFRRALERESHHRPSLLQIIDVATARKDWKTVVEAKRDLFEGANEDERVRLFDDIGDVYYKELADPVAALGAYLEAIKMRPKAHAILHKTLEIYSEQKQWRRAVETLGAIAATATKPERRAKYFYTAAVIARDELGDIDMAVENFDLALDEDATTPKAFDAIDTLLAKKGDYKNLARAYRKMLKRVGENAPTSQLLKLWTRLGDICLEQLTDNEAAIAAYEVASSLDTENLDRHEQLANLYLESGESRRDDAIAELQVLVGAFPNRVELYRALSDLYRESDDLDKAFCLAQALVFLDAATDAEHELYERYRPRRFSVAKRRLTEELWQKAIIHRAEDRHLNAMFASLVASIAATTAQPSSAFNLQPKQRTDVDKDSNLATRVFRYATNILGLDPVPSLYLTPDSTDGIRVANTAEKGKLLPSVLIGSPHLDKRGEMELAFDMGKRLSYFRPERYVTYALQTLPRIEGAFRAALAATGLEGQVAVEGDVGKLAVHIKKTVPAAVLDQVGVVAQKIGHRSQNGLIAGWRSATDLTANRVGLVLCNDFEVAARSIATEPPGISTLGAKDRLRDLLAYSVSESYFAVRRHLGLAVEGPG
jgi:tetratricopeptide (TPR) repeat protein